MSDDAPKATGKTLSDGDISTHARRAGPDGVGADNDSDSHSDSDAHAAAATDHDAAPAAHTDSDAPTDAPSTDKDT